MRAAGVGGWLVPAIRYCSFALAAQRLLFVFTSVRASFILWPLKHWLLVRVCVCVRTCVRALTAQASLCCS